MYDACMELASSPANQTGCAGGMEKIMVLTICSESEKAMEDKALCAIKSIMELMKHAVNEDDLIGRVTERLRHILDSKSAFFYTVDGPGDRLVLKGAAEAEADLLANAMADRVLACRRTQIVNNMALTFCEDRPSDQWKSISIRNQLATPVQHGGRMLAVLMVRDTARGSGYGVNEARLLEIIAHHAAIEIDNRRLCETNRRIEHLARLGASLAEMTHTLKNKLSLWEGAAKLADRQMQPFADPAQGEVWQMQLRAAQGISRLVRGILNIAAAPETEEAKPTDVNALLNELLQCHEAQAGEVGARLTFTPDAAVPVCLIPAEQLLDAVANLVGNALDAIRESNPGERRVALSTNFDPDAGRILILVEDNGPGIPEEMHGQIFSQSFTTKGSRGTGLGLLMTYRKITSLGGTIQFQSQPGEGTTFRISLPAGL